MYVHWLLYIVHYKVCDRTWHQ